MNEPKKIGTGLINMIAIFICVISIALYYVIHDTGGKPKKIQASYPSADQPTTITLTTDWSPVVYNRRDMVMESFMRTPNLWWQIRVNGDMVYDRVPINYPESKVMTFTTTVYTLEWRIAPPTTAGVDPSKLTGQLEYYFRPNPKVASAN